MIELRSATCITREHISGVSPGSTIHEAPSDPLRHVVFLGDRGVAKVGIEPHEHGRGALSSTVPAQEQLIDPLLADFYQRLFERVSLQSDRYRETVLRRRAGACLRAVGARDLIAARAMVERDSAAAERGMQAVAIGVTSFFRDPHVFEALQAPILALAKARGEGLRILSVGCSDGRELYSIALLLESLSVCAEVLHGVDCRESAIRIAANGRYLASQVDDVPLEMRTASFVSVTGSNPPQFQLHPRIRERCRWWASDAFTLTSPVPYDLVLCRNLLIYLSPDAASQLWLRLRALVATDGFLIVGKAERPPVSAALRRIAPCIFQQRDEIA